MYLFKKTLATFLSAVVMLSVVSTTASATQSDSTEMQQLLTASSENESEKSTPADYSMITRVKKNIPYDIETYTDESVARLQAVLDSIVYGLDSSQQAVVDAYAEELLDAFFALEKKKADMSYLEDVLSEIPEDLSIYTEETVANLHAEIEKAEAEIVKIQVDDYMAIAWLETYIRDKIEKLELKSLDYEPVEIAKSKIPSDLSMYIEETVNELNDALANAPESRTHAEMDKWAAEIEAAVKGLQLKPADYTAVENALKKIPEDLSLYTKESVASLKALLLMGGGGLTIDKQAQVDAEARAIEAAVASLKIKVENVTNVEFTESGYVVTVEGKPEKIQFIGNDTTRTYTRENNIVTIESYDINGKLTDIDYQTVYEKWTVNVELPSSTYGVVARYRKVWDTLAFEFGVKNKAETPEIDDKFVSADVKLNGLEATYTVVTGLDITKIQITDNGSTKTLASGYTDTDVRTWIYTKTVSKGEHNVVYAYKTDAWKTAEVNNAYVAKAETENEAPEKGEHSGTVTSSVLKGEKVEFAVTTTTAVSKIQFVFENGDTITLASGYDDINGIRRWVYSKEFSLGEYSVKTMAKYGREWVDTEIVLNFEVL